MKSQKVAEQLEFSQDIRLSKAQLAPRIVKVAEPPAPRRKRARQRLQIRISDQGLRAFRVY